MKIYKKSECAIIDGQVTFDSEVLYLSPVVYSMLHLLDEQVQKAEYLSAQPKAQAAPSLDGFKKRSNYSLPLLEKPKTPVGDKQVKIAMAIMRENDELVKVGEINGLITEMQPLFDWVASEHTSDSGTQHPRIDLPVLGNPLELTVDKLVECIKAVAEAAEVEGV